MKMTAIRDVELNDHIYHKGDVADYDGVIDERIKACFTPEGGVWDEKATKSVAKEALDDDALIAEKIAKTIKTLKKQGIEQALDGLGITFNPRSSTEFLAKLLLITRGEIEE